MSLILLYHGVSLTNRYCRVTIWLTWKCRRAWKAHEPITKKRTPTVSTAADTIIRTYCCVSTWLAYLCRRTTVFNCRLYAQSVTGDKTSDGALPVDRYFVGIPLEINNRNVSCYAEKSESLSSAQGSGSNWTVVEEIAESSRRTHKIMRKGYTLYCPSVSQIRAVCLVRKKQADDSKRGIAEQEKLGVW